MADDPWLAATFAGASSAQADAVANLTPTQRVGLLEELLRLATASGALQCARRAKQAEIDEAWAAGEALGIGGVGPAYRSAHG